MDDFKRIQKSFCGGPKWFGKGSLNYRNYGCSCCRKISSLRHFKRFCRKRAKQILRTHVRKMFAKGREEEL